MISGVSTDGKKFFYENPLASQGNHHRQDWYDCSCCPPNIVRLLASLGGYVYSQNDTEIAVHLYLQNSADMTLKGQKVSISQQTNYPWDGKISLIIGMEKPTDFALLLRIPEWCQKAFWNGKEIDIQNDLVNGYFRIEQLWDFHNDCVLEMEMPAHRIYSHPDIRENEGKVALQRGPLLYCVEETDQEIQPYLLTLPPNASLTEQCDEELFNGAVVIKTDANYQDVSQWNDFLYRQAPKPLKQVELKAIPYYLWDSREPGQMRVWLPEA